MKVDLDELERLAAKATPGPWTADNWSRVWHEPKQGVRRTVADCVRVTVKSPKQHRANARLIAAMHKAVPELVARVRELEETVITLQIENDTINELRAAHWKQWEERVRELERELETYKQPIDFPKLREDVAHVDNSLSEYLEDSIKRAAARP
jgi:hypothetical protein